MGNTNTYGKAKRYEVEHTNIGWMVLDTKTGRFVTQYSLSASMADALAADWNKREDEKIAATQARFAAQAKKDVA